MGDERPGTLDHLELSNGAVARVWADEITRTAKSASVLVRYKADPRTGMDGVPAIVTNSFGSGKTAYVGCRLGREGLARSLPELLAAMGIRHALGSQSGEVLRIERVAADDGGRFSFLFNRAGDDVTVALDGKPEVVSLAEIAAGGESAVIRPNGVIVLRARRAAAAGGGR